MKLTPEQYDNWQTLSVFEKLILAEFNINTDQQEPATFHDGWYDIHEMMKLLESVDRKYKYDLQATIIEVERAIANLTKLNLF